MLMKPYRTLLLLLIILVPVLQQCSVDSFESRNNVLTDQESQFAGQIIGESISENQSGLLSAFSEAFAVPSASELMPGTATISTGSFRNLNDYQYEFNPATGIHHVTFSREVTDTVSSTMSDFELQYLFLDRNGNVIEDPVHQQHEIETLEYLANRTGEIQAGSKTSIFTRTDQLSVDGLSSGTEILRLDGFHTGEGIFRQTLLNGDQVEREYLLDINFLDIRINKPIVELNRNFRKGVNGALSYESTIRQVDSGASESKIVNGTIQLNGDGTALLRFREQFDTFRLKLDRGEVFDEDEFEGRISQVDTQQQIFTLTNGQRIQINDQTEIEDGDFMSLDTIAAALDNGARITAEGDYFKPDENRNLWIATEVEFELESNEFEDIVEQIDLNQKSFTLANGDRFFWNESSEIEFENGFDSIEDVAEAINNGLPILAEGDFYIDLATGNRIVKDVEFELDLDEFDHEIVSVDLEQQQFTLENGNTVLIIEQTDIVADGDFSTLQEVKDAMDEGKVVGAEGKYYFDSNENIWIAVEVEFFD